MRKLVQWMAAWAIAVGSLAIGSNSHGAVVTLNATGGLNTGVSPSATLSFLLPADVLTINSFTFDFTYEASAAPGPILGTASLEFALLQSIPFVAGADLFGITGVYAISPTGPTNQSITASVGDPSFAFTLSDFTATYSMNSLSSTGVWNLLAGNNISIFVYNGADGSFTNVVPTITAATLTLDYNPTGGGVVPEPSTLAIALVGLAGWRGRRMLRRR
jgi:hypothetical protein